MKNYRKVLVYLMLVALLCGFPFSVSAETAHISDDLQEDDFDSVAALAYGLPPDNLHPFVYSGQRPFAEMGVDTSLCKVGALYVYNAVSDTVAEIYDGNTTTYASTKDHLFFVTENQTIIQTDYTCSDLSEIYSATRGEVTVMIAFGEYLYFVEGEQHIVVIDVPEISAATVLTAESVLSAYMFDIDKMIWRDGNGNPNYLNLTTGVSTALENEYEANCLIETYMRPAVDGNVVLYSTSEEEDDYNDVLFPLEEYRAPFEIGGWAPEEVKSYFLNEDGSYRWYAGSYQCDGFAKYAHDRFWHFDTDGRTSPSWQINGTSSTTDDYTGASPAEIANQSFTMGSHPEMTTFNSAADVRAFFTSLDRGSFVRYVSRDDETPYNGNHSIAFDRLSDDGTGIIVYECNQDGNCGVGYQQYTFAQICSNYIYVLYYVEHDLESPAYENTSTHTVPCANCDGFLRQNHTGTGSCQLKSVTEHIRGRTCCSGGVVETHMGSKSYTYQNLLNHKFVAACCVGEIIEAHTSKSYIIYSTTQHQIFFQCCDQTVYQQHMFKNGKCSGCGYVEGGFVVQPGKKPIVETTE